MKLNDKYVVATLYFLICNFKEYEVGNKDPVFVIIKYQNQKVLLDKVVTVSDDKNAFWVIQWFLGFCGYSGYYTKFQKIEPCENKVAHTVIPKDYWDKKNFQDMGPLSVNSIHISVLLFEKNEIF